MMNVAMAGPAWSENPPVPDNPGQYHHPQSLARHPIAALPALPDTAPAPEDEDEGEGEAVAHPDITLAEAISLAYRTNPTLEAGRYDLVATDETLGAALSEIRPSSSVQVTGQYNWTDAGRTTQANRAIYGESSIFTSNSLGAQLIVSQPIYTGGKASADIAAAKAAIRAGRAGLQATEGDLLLSTITAYCDIQRDTRTLAIRANDLAKMRLTLDEVGARRKAGELTRTDIAQTETQIQNAEAAYYLTRTQQEQSRATFAELVGIDAGVLAPVPPLPQLPATIDEAFDQALMLNPNLAEARFTEASSREKIAAARAANRPTFALQASAGPTGVAVPFYLHNDDQELVVQGILTIPLTSGGRNGAAIAQAEATNSGDQQRIEAERRLTILNIANAWNQMVTLRRNVQLYQAEVQSGQIFYEGSLNEYRSSLRSTFDVLYAQETLLNAKVALVAAQHDLYVAQATLLRQTGLLDVASIATGVGLYDESADIRQIEHRGAVPWDAPVRALNRLGKPGTRYKHMNGEPAVLPEQANLAPPTDAPPADSYATRSESAAALAPAPPADIKGP